MSSTAPTDAESFYNFLSNSLGQGDRETPPETLLRQWREQREFEATCAAIQEGFEQMEAGLGRPVEEVFAELKRKHGIAEP